MAQYLCPVCRAPRYIELRDHIAFSAHVKIILVVGLLCGIAYILGGLVSAVRMGVFYFPLWGAAEFWLWLKLRKEAPCQVCSFDPLLYQRDWKAARLAVETRLQAVSDQMKARRQTQGKSPATKPENPPPPHT
jgi:hypothetical protein